MLRLWHDFGPSTAIERVEVAAHTPERSEKIRYYSVCRKWQEGAGDAGGWEWGIVVERVRSGGMCVRVPRPGFRVEERAHRRLPVHMCICPRLRLQRATGPIAMVLQRSGHVEHDYLITLKRLASFTLTGPYLIHEILRTKVPRATRATHHVDPTVNTMRVTRNCDAITSEPQRKTRRIEEAEKIAARIKDGAPEITTLITQLPNNTVRFPDRPTSHGARCCRSSLLPKPVPPSKYSTAKYEHLHEHSTHPNVTFRQ
jgi:hypothetical protein